MVIMVVVMMMMVMIVMMMMVMMTMMMMLCHPQCSLSSAPARNRCRCHRVTWMVPELVAGA